MDLDAAVAAHVSAFNAAVTGGAFAEFAERFADDAVMRFVGVPSGPYTGRDAIRAAYGANPPDDTMTVAGVERVDDATARARFAWTRGGGGELVIAWTDDGLVSTLVVRFES